MHSNVKALLKFYGEEDWTVQPEFVYSFGPEARETHAKRMPLSSLPGYIDGNKCMVPGKYIINVVNVGPTLDIDIFCEENEMLNYLYEEGIFTKEMILAYVAEYTMSAINEHVPLDRLDYFFDYGSGKGLHLFYAFKDPGDCYFLRSDDEAEKLIQKNLGKWYDRYELKPGQLYNSKYLNYGLKEKARGQLVGDKYIVDEALFAVVMSQLIKMTRSFDQPFFTGFVEYALLKIPPVYFYDSLRHNVLHDNIVTEDEASEILGVLKICQKNDISPLECVKTLTGFKVGWDESSLSFGPKRAAIIILDLFRPRIDQGATAANQTLRVPYGLSKLNTTKGRHHFKKGIDFRTKKIDLLVNEDEFRRKQDEWERDMFSSQRKRPVPLIDQYLI